MADGMRTIGESMRLARRVRGYSATELSELAGVSRTALYQAERGETFPSILNISALADVLGISIDDYIGRRVRRDV